MDNRLIWLLGIFGISILLGGGVWFWSEFIARDNSPTIQSVSLEPATLRFMGGYLNVRAEVTDDVAVEKVTGLLMSGDTPIARLAMQRTGNGQGELVYAASLSLPPNLHSNGQPVEYALQVLAMDNMNQESVEEISFQVPAPAAPPAPPHLSPVD